MVKPTDIVVDLKNIDKEDVLYVGGKSANLGEMIAAGFPVPGGFVVTAHAYYTFIKENNLDTKIKHLLGTIDYDNPDSINQVASNIRKIIKNAKIPHEIAQEVFREYEKIGGSFKDAYVAIRSSATSEDSKEASFAGQQETFLNIKGDAAVLHSIRDAWASLFNARAVYYRHENKLDRSKSGIALVVQKMVASESSGIMFTIDPVENDKTKVVVEAIYGLGEYIVGGKVTPDHFKVDKKTGEITEKKVVAQRVMLQINASKNKETKVPKNKQDKQKISDKDVKELAEIAKRIEKHYYFPQDIEWAKEKGKLYIVQTRPVTTTSDAKAKKKSDATATIAKMHKPFLLGDPASPGIASGHVKILKSPKEIGKINQGDILVAQQTNPDFVPAMKKAVAIITERGGRTSHAAIVSREFGIPAVVGASLAIKKLKEDEVVTVNGRTGEIYKGNIVANAKTSEAVPHSHKHTKTKIMVNLAQPELAEKISEYPVDGIGLLRAEFMIAQIGTHPKKLIEDGKEKVFIDELTDNISKFCKAFYPRPILYRTTDFKTNEYHNLKGGAHFEPKESNPMLGYRGAFRYIKDERVFKLELEAIKKVRREYNNLSLMLPFVRTVKELENTKHIITKAGLRRSHTFKLYMMVEVPSNVILIDEFINKGIDGISIGSNDLTMLTLGIDRDNEEVAIEFDERNPAVLWSLERVIKSAKKHGITSSICGQGPSTYPDLVEKLVKWGVTSVSVSPDAVDSTRELVYMVEKHSK